MVKSPLDDLTLVNQYIAGQESALEILINRHKKEVYRAISKLIRDQNLVHDVFQDTFIKVIHILKSGQYNDEGKFLPWLVRVAQNKAMDEMRKRRRKNVYESLQDDMMVFDSVCDNESTMEEYIINSQTHKSLNHLLKQLPEDQRRIIVLRHFEGLSFKEISVETKLCINTAVGRMRYALINLRKIIEENKIDIG